MRIKRGNIRGKQTTVSDWFEYEEKSDLAATIDGKAAEGKSPANDELL